jgi:hypothetical protein
MGFPAGIARDAKCRRRFAAAGAREAGHERVLGSTEVNSLPDAERDAYDVVQALAGLAELLGRREAELDEKTRILLSMARDGGVPAARVLAYLRDLRGAGDGVAVAVPPRLGAWRDWVPPRGDLLGEVRSAPHADPMSRRRRDPGE